MKFLLSSGLVFFSVALIYGVEVPLESLNEKVVECVKEFNIDFKSLPSLFDEKLHFKTRSKVVEDLLDCAVVRRQLIKDGKIDSAQMEWDVEHVLFPSLGKGDILDIKAKAKEVVKNCIHVTGYDLVDIMMNLHNCLADEVHKV
ncbi:hypothetical protein FQA39_LY03828 [Lamprigera yunnana]|nr:hypothetical protein FQA39_LY03828 [Lamprigera yunnana]